MPRKQKVAFERYNHSCNMIKFEFWKDHSGDGMKNEQIGMGGCLEAEVKAESHRDHKI